MTRQAVYWVLERNELVHVGARPAGEAPETAMARVLHDYEPAMYGVYAAGDHRNLPSRFSHRVRDDHSPAVMHALAGASRNLTGVRVERSWRVAGTLHLQRVPAADGADDEPDRILATLGGRRARPYGDLAYVQDPTWAGDRDDAADWDPADLHRWLAWAGFEALSPVHVDPDGHLEVEVLTGTARP